MNGRRFRLDPLTNGQAVAADLGRAMLEGDNNVVILTGGGETGTSAVVMITDTPGANLVVLPELVKLGVARTQAGLELSWPETLSAWQLQSSTVADANWTEVASTPVTVSGQWTVTIPAADGAQFYRLRGPATTPSATAAEGDGTGAELHAPNGPQPQSLKRAFDGILW
jgi:hypothetical protein